MEKIWVNKADSFADAERFDRDYYLKMTNEERLETVQFLRESYYKLTGTKNEDRKRLRRVINVIEQK
ncbi:MAG: hypothetical protein QME42_04980 [bacterium]|nr:hypothetical protein [bacterium]